MLLCLFVFESLGALDVSHLRRSICCSNGAKEDFLSPLALPESNARKRALCELAYLCCPSHRGTCFHSISQSSYSAIETSGELRSVVQTIREERTGRASCPVVHFLLP